MRIVFVGTAKKSTTCDQRYRAMLDLGYEVERVDMKPADVVRREGAFWYRAYRKLAGPIDLAGANRAILAALARGPVDVLWLEKALTIEKKTLETVRQVCPDCVIIGYSPDDMTGNPANRSPQFLGHLPCYDIYFTTKTFCVDELLALGCPRVEFNPNAYDRSTHRPYEPTDEDRDRLGGKVGFIGAWEPERDEVLLFLAENGINVRIWGGGWQRSRLAHENLKIERRELWGEDYARAMSCFDINLNFLRRCNRDLQTQRSVEIPACGGFMLTERTEEHRALFEEDREAVYFGDNQEMLDKIRYYLVRPEACKRIAAAGRQRCLTSGYSYHERITTMLERALALKVRRNSNIVMEPTNGTKRSLALS